MARFLFGSIVPALLLASGPVHAADRPNNPVGVHLMIRDARSDENIEKHTAWARRVCGPWGYVKIFEYQITPETQKPADSLIKLIDKLYERELIPVVRLGGVMKNDIWQRPADTPDGTFGDIAEAFKRVVQILPLSDQCPLYIEVWNEPNLGLEWSGTPRPADFAKMYVRAAKAIRSIGDPRIRVAPGAMSPGGEYKSLDFIDAMCEAEPEFVNSFDYWATHPYPGATPPEYNIHDQTTTMQFACIDLWVYELDRLAAHGCDVSQLQVIGTETSYRLGHGGGDEPIIDEVRRADYHLRTIRDYWMNWPEVLGMCIWDFANPFDKNSNSVWVHADSTTDETGWPSMPKRDFEYVAALAKPTSDYACVSGRLTDDRTRAGVPDIRVSVSDTDIAFTTDRFGNFILSPIVPDVKKSRLIRYNSSTHSNGTFEFVAGCGENVIIDKGLRATALATLRGMVINTQTGRPIADALVTANPGHFGTRSNRTGIFELNQLPHGYYDVAVTCNEFYPHRQSTKLLVAGRSTEHEYRLGPGTEPPDSMVSNGGFEQADANARTPLGWETIGSENALSLDTGIVYAGDRAQRIEADAGKEAGITQWTGYTTIAEGRRYRLQCWLRTAGVKANAGQGARLTATVVTNPHKTLMELESKKVLTGDSPWTLLSIDFAAPANAGRVCLTAQLTAKAGTAWADEAAVVELD